MTGNSHDANQPKANADSKPFSVDQYSPSPLHQTDAQQSRSYGLRGPSSSAEYGHPSTVGDSDSAIPRTDSLSEEIVPTHVQTFKRSRLPNCKITGIRYGVPFLGESFAAVYRKQLVVSIEFKHDGEKLDWSYDPEIGEIFCNPTNPGEYQFEIVIIFKNGICQVYPYLLTVNPDPKTLWKNIPSDPNGIYAKPDCDKSFLACGDRNVVVASQRGRSHAQEGKPRDDDFAYNYDRETECHILAVADGAGSAKFSRKGSQIAVTTARDMAIQYTGKAYWDEIEAHVRKWKTTRDETSEKQIQTRLYKVLITAAFDAKTKISQEAKAHEARFNADYKKAEKFSAKDYATTLILTIAKRFDFGWFVATYWVGDGGVGIYMPEQNKVILHGIPDSGEYGGQTCFLTMDSVWPNDANVLIQRRIRFDVVDSFGAIVLMTDGVTDPKFETEVNLKSITHWSGLWSDITSTVPLNTSDSAVADELLKWMDFWSPGNHDDRTMMILY